MSSKKSKKRMGSTRRHHQGPKTEEKEGNAELQESSSAEHLQPSEMPKGQLDSVPENQEGDQHDAKQMCSEKSEIEALAEICEAETIAPGKKRRMGSTRRAKQEHQVVEKKEEEEKEDEGMQIIQEEFNTTEDQRLKESSNTTEVVLDEALTQSPEGWSKVKAEMTEDVSPNDEQHSFVSGLNLKTETEACSTENPSPGVNLIVSVAGIHPNEEKAVFDAKEISPNETRLQDTSQGLAQQTEEHAEVSEREEPWWGKNDFESNTERVDMESISVEGDNKQDVSLRQESREIMQIEKEDDDSVRKMEVECAGVQDFSLQMQDTTQIRELPSTESQLLVEGHSKPSDASADGTEMKGYTMSGNQNNLETEQIGSVSISQGEAKNSQYHQKPKKRMGSTRRPLKEPKEMEEDIANNQVVTQEIRENIIQDPNMAKDDMQVREMAFTMSIRGEDLEGAVDVTEKEKNKQDFPDENTGKDTEACPSNEFLTDNDATTRTTTSIDQERSLMEEMLHTELFKALEPSTNMDFLEQAPPLVDPSPDYIETTIENPERMDSASHQVDFGTLREASDSFEQGHLSSSPTSHDSPGIVVAPPNVHAESSSLTVYHSDVKHNEEEEHGTQSHILSDPMESESISTDVLDFGSHSVHAEITDTTETSTFTDYEFSFKLQHHEEEEDVKQGVSSQKRRMGSTRRTKREHKMEETCEAVIVKGKNINEVVNMNIDSDLSTEAKGDIDMLRETELENIDTCTGPTIFGQDEDIDKSTTTETTFPQRNVQADGQDNRHEYTDIDITTEQLDDDLKDNNEISILSKETAEVVTNQIDVEMNSPNVKQCKEEEQWAQFHIASSTSDVSNICIVGSDFSHSIHLESSSTDVLEVGSHSLHAESTDPTETNTFPDHSESSIKQHHAEEEGVTLGGSKQKRRMGSTRRTKREHKMEETCDVVTTEGEESTEGMNMKTDSDLKAEAEVDVIGASQEKEFVTSQIEVETLSAPIEQCQDIDSSPDCSASTVEGRDAIEKAESFSCQMGVETLTCLESLTSSSLDQTTEIAIMTQNMHSENFNIEMLRPDIQHSEETEQRTQVPILSSTVESEVSITADVSDSPHSLGHEEDDSVKQSASRQKRRMGSTRRTKREQKMEETLNTEGDNATEDMNIDADLRTETEGDVLKVDIILASEETELVTSQTNVETVSVVSSPNEEDQYANSSISSETMSSFSLYSPREDELMQENQHQCPDINTEQLDVNDLKGDEMSIPRQETVEAITTMGADIPNEGSMSEDGDKFKKHEDEKQEKSLESLGHQSMEDIKMEVSEQAVENMLSSSREDLSPNCSATIVDNIDISEKSESFSCQITVDALASLGSSTTLDPFPETAVTCQNVCLEVNTPDVQRSEEAEQGTQAHILSSTMESVESSISMDVSVSDFSHSLAVESTLGTDTVSEHSESSLTLQHHEEDESVKQGASSQKRRMGSTRRSKREHKMEETCEIQKETMPEQAEGENELSPMDDPRPNCVATTVEAMDTTEKRESLSFQIDVETLTCLKSPSTHSTDHVPEIVSILQNVQAESSDQDESSFKLQHHEEEETVKVVTNQTDIEKNSSDVQQCEEEQQSVQSQILSATLEVSNVCTVVPDFSHSLHVERTDTSETNTFTDQSESSLKVQHNEEEEGVKLGGSKQKRRMGSTRRTKTEHKMEETCEVVTTEGDATENINMKIDADLRAEVEGDIIDASKGEEFVTTQTDVETQGQDANSNTLDEMVQSSSQCSSLQEDILQQETQHEHHNVISLQDDFKDNNELSTVGKETVIMPVGPEDFNEASIDAHDDQLQIQEEQKSENTLEPQGDQDKGNIISTALAEDETKLSSTAEGPTTVESMDTSESPCEPDTFNMEITNVTESGALSPEQWGSSLRIHPHEKERDSKQDSSKQKRKMGSTRRRKKESDDMHLDGTQSSQATGEITGMVTETDVEMREEEHLLSEQISSSEERQAVNPDTTPVEEFKDYQTQMIETSEETVVEQNEEDMSSNETTFLSVEVPPEVTICLEAADVDSCTKLQPSSCLPLDNQVNVNPDTDVTCPENSESIQIENQTKQDQGFTSSESDHLERDLKANPRRKIGSTRRVNRRQVDEINQGKDVVTEETQIILEEDNKGGNILITQEVEVLEAQREEDSGPLETQRGAQNDTIADEWEMIERQTQNTVPEMSVTISQYQETEGSPGLARRRKLGSTRRSRKEQTERKYVVMDGMLMYTDSETNSTDDCKSVDGEVKDKEERGIHESEEDSEVVPCNTMVSPPDSLKTIQETSNNDKDEQCILAGAITTAEWPPQVGEAGNDNSSVHGDTLAVNIITPPLEASDSSEESKPRKKRMGSSRKISQRRQKDKAESHSEADVRYEVLESVTSAADKQPIEQDTGGTGEADKERLEGPVNDTSTDFHESEYSKPAEQTHTYPEGPAVTGLHEQSHFGKTEISESNENRAAETSFNSTLSADDSVTEPRSMLHKRKTGSSRRGKGLGKRMTDVANVEEHVDDSNTLRQETGDKTALQNTEDLSVEGEHLLLAPQSNESDQQPLTQGETPNELIDERAIPESALGASSASSEPQQDNPSIDTQSLVKKRKMGSTRKNIWRHSDDTTNSNLQREQAPSPERCSDNTATGDIEALPVAAETALTLKMSEVVQPKGISAQKESTGHGSAGHKQDSDSTRRKMGSRRGGQGYRGIGAVGAPENRPVSQGQDDGSLLQGTQEENVPSEDVPEQGPSKQSSQREKNTQSEQPPAGARSKSDLEIRSDQVPTLTSLGEAVMFNIVMVGDSSVGKTSFIRRLEKGQFLPESSATLGVDTSILPLVVDGKLVKLQIWDTAGQERFHSITRQVLHKAQGLILMYDVSSCQTFSAVRKWIACIEDGAPSEVIILLLGNKNDSEDRQVLHPEGKRLAEEYNIHFMECSAATGNNVSQAMETLARLLKETVKETDQQYVSLHKKPQPKKSGCC